jgi:hypothetical protein
MLERAIRELSDVERKRLAELKAKCQAGQCEPKTAPQNPPAEK